MESITMTTITGLAETETAGLDSLIAEVEHAGGARHELLLEHLRCARSYLLGAMPQECELNLKLAQQAVHDVPEPGLRHQVTQAISVWLSQARAKSRERQLLPHHPPPATRGDEPKGRLARLLQDSRTWLGLFYPKHFVVAVFRSFDAAQSASRTLHNADFGDDEVLAVPGEEMLHYLKDMRARSGLWTGLAAELSRVLDTEANLADREVDLARRGAGFLLAYAPTEPGAARVSETVKPFGPLAIVWYHPYYIRHLI
jgi:hypothetical protein